MVPLMFHKKTDSNRGRVGRRPAAPILVLTSASERCAASPSSLHMCTFVYPSIPSLEGGNPIWGRGSARGALPILSIEDNLRVKLPLPLPPLSLTQLVGLSSKKFEFNSPRRVLLGAAAASSPPHGIVKQIFGYCSHLGRLHFELGYCKSTTTSLEKKSKTNNK